MIRDTHSVYCVTVIIITERQRLACNINPNGNSNLMAILMFMNESVAPTHFSALMSFTLADSRFQSSQFFVSSHKGSTTPTSNSPVYHPQGLLFFRSSTSPFQKTVVPFEKKDSCTTTSGRSESQQHTILPPSPKKLPDFTQQSHLIYL